MIAIDTSALMAILLNEPQADACVAVLQNEGGLLISAATVAEALIVADRRNLGPPMARLIEGLGLQVDPVTLDSARRVADAYAAWGKGAHPAGLNVGDCFAYATAQRHACRLLYVGDHFAQTDAQGVL